MYVLTELTKLYLILSSVKYHKLHILHIFDDASIDAYISVYYWRIFYGNSIGDSFIYGKALLLTKATRRMMSVAQMELQAGVLGVRMKESD